MYGGKNRSTIVFVPSKRDCNNLMISDKIKMEVQIINGDINQKQREATFEAFKSGKFKCLVATDVASRGLDIPHVDLVIQSHPPKELDTYIHRAGRTARAGRSGVCITLYTKIEEENLNRVERRAKINFVKIGAPQTTDLVLASTRDVLESVKSIDLSVCSMFEASAEQIKEQYGEKEAIQRLLAFVSGYSAGMKSRSIICGAEGFVTYIIRTTQKINNVGYVWSLLKKIVPFTTTESIKGMRMLANMDGAIFDLPEDSHTIFEELLYNDRFYGENYKLERPTSIPELMDQIGYDLRRPNSYGTNTHNMRSSSANIPRNRDSKKDIFIGNIPYGVSEGELSEWIESQGIGSDKATARLVIDKETNRMKGFGFISCYDDKTYSSVLSLNGKRFKDKTVRINDANSKPAK